jgi:hypothetical protein
MLDQDDVWMLDPDEVWLMEELSSQQPSELLGTMLEIDWRSDDDDDDDGLGIRSILDRPDVLAKAWRRAALRAE